MTRGCGVPIVAVLLVFAFGFLAGHAADPCTVPLVNLNTTDSVANAKGIWITIPGRPRVGDMVVFPLTVVRPEVVGRYCGYGLPHFLLKRLVAIDRDGATVLGTHPQSFDSRYYGTVSYDALRRAIRILPFP